MNNFEYEEKYGERVLSDYEEREEEQRVKDRDRLEDLEKALDGIKSLIQDSEAMSKEDVIGELKWITESL